MNTASKIKNRAIGKMKNLTENRKETEGSPLSKDEGRKTFNLLAQFKGVRQFYFWNGKEVLEYRDRLVIGDKTLPIGDDDKFNCENGVLYQIKYNENHDAVTFRFDGNAFVEDKSRYEFDHYLTPHLSCSYEYDEGEKKMLVSLVENEEEFLFDFSSEEDYCFNSYIEQNGIIVFANGCMLIDNLLFYTRNGERLWEYQAEEGWEVKKNVYVVDNIVVINSENENSDIKYKHEGYNLFTGEKLWETGDTQYNVHFKIGPNNLLYDLGSCWTGHEYQLQLTKLNPYTGELDTTILKKGNYWKEIEPWNTTIHGNKLYYTKKKEIYKGMAPNDECCSLGLIDLDNYELIDVALGACDAQLSVPLFQDDKMYVVVGWRLLKVLEMKDGVPVLVDAPEKTEKTLDELDEIDELRAITGCKCVKPNKKLSLLDEYNKLREEGREKGFIPVLVSYDILTINSMKSNIGIIESTVSEVKKTVKDFHKKMLAMAVADGKVFLHKNWTQEPTDEDEKRIWSAKKGRNTEKNSFSLGLSGSLYFVKVPVTDPWLIWVYLPYGGWNACPDVKTQIAVSKYWYEQYAALPVCICDACVDYRLEKPLETPYKAAKEMYEYCCDIIEQSHNDIEKLAKDIRNVEFWNFWWD